MAQTNDSKLLEKVLSKATEDYSQDDAIMTLSTNNEMGITDFDSYKTGYLSGARRMQKEARLATLDDCKTLLEVVNQMVELLSAPHTAESRRTLNIKLKAALAELEALRKKDARPRNIRLSNN